MIPLLLGLTAFAANPLTLEEAMDLGADAPAAQAARADARAARADTTTAWLGAAAPRVGGTLTTTSRTEEIAIDTPIGAFVQQPKDLAEAGLRGSWPLLDPAGMLGRAPAAAAGAKASALLAERAEQQARLDAAEAFLDVRQIEAAIEALAQQEQALATRMAQAQSLVDEGLAVQVDTLRIRVALADVAVARTRLEAQRSAALDVLAWRTGRDQAPEIRWTWSRPDEPEAIAGAWTDAAGRPDLRALDEERRAMIRQQRATWLEALPTVGAWGQWVWTDNEALVANQWVEGGLEIAWTPVVGGTRASRARAIAQRRHAVEARREDAHRGLRAQLAAERASLVGALAEIDARQLSVDHATEAERLLTARYAQGLATTGDVLDATASLAEQRSALTTAQVQATRAELRWRFARGSL